MSLDDLKSRLPEHAKDLKLNVQTYDPAAYYNLVKDAPVPISRQGKQLDRVLKSLGRQ